MKETTNTQNRRKFLADCGRMTSLPVISTMLNMSMFNSVMGARSKGSITDYKSIIYVWMNGGNDSFNMLVPHGREQYDMYKEARRHFAHPRNALNPINTKEGVQDLAVAPAMTEVADMFNKGELSFVANVGTLNHPQTIQEYRSRNVNRPYGLFSHSEQQQIWQSSFGLSRRERGFSNVGWAGRMLDILNSGANTGSDVSAAITTGQGGKINRGNEISSFGVGTLEDYTFYHDNASTRPVIQDSIAREQENVLASHYNYVRQRTIDQTEFLYELVKKTEFKTKFPANSWGRQFKEIAVFIKNRELFGHNRQSFVAGNGGFDIHAGSRGGHNSSMGGLSAALYALNEVLKELGVHDKVVVCTGSDFGRTLQPNSQGTDHGYGGNQIVMGGPIVGGEIFGEYPDELVIGGGLDVGRGRQLPTTSIDQYHATIAKWYGITDSEMPLIIPTVDRWPNGGVIPGMINFAPDPNVEYTIENPQHGLRLAALENSNELISLPIDRAGVNTRWKFVQHVNGLWHIERAAGGATPRLRSALTSVPRLNSTSTAGAVTRFSILPNPVIPGTFLLTVPEANTELRRLRVRRNGLTEFVDETHMGKSTGFVFNPVQ